MDWRQTTLAIRAAKLRTAQVDPRGGMPHSPHGGASPAAIAAVERRFGRALPVSYREFLSAHDGWPELFSGATLLGCRSLVRGTYEAIAALVLQEAVALRGLGSSDRVVPFGIDPSAETVFAFVVSGTPPGEELPIVVWAGGVGRLVEGFPAFLRWVLDRIAADLEDRMERMRRARFAHGMASLAEVGALT